MDPASQSNGSTGRRHIYGECLSTHVLRILHDGLLRPMISASARTKYLTLLGCTHEPCTKRGRHVASSARLPIGLALNLRSHFVSISFREIQGFRHFLRFTPTNRANAVQPPPVKSCSDGAHSRHSNGAELSPNSCYLDNLSAAAPRGFVHDMRPRIAHGKTFLSYLPGPTTTLNRIWLAYKSYFRNASHVCVIALLQNRRRGTTSFPSIRSPNAHYRTP